MIFSYIHSAYSHAGHPLQTKIMMTQTKYDDKYLILVTLVTLHIAPRGAKKEEAFGGVILKSERPSGALFTNSGPPFFTVESKIEVLSPLGTSFH